jgi:hypothetical protein
VSEHLVTLRLKLDSEDGYVLPREAVGCYAGVHWIKRGPHIVKVEPAPRELPTEQGSLILAHITPSAPSLLELAFHDGVPAWFYADAMSFGPVMVSEIGTDWVQIDPKTLRPIEDPS